MIDAPLAVQGYASVFGVADLEGDVVHAGAFRRSLAQRTTPLPMLLSHDARLKAGVWRSVIEDSRGLFVRGEIAPDAPAAAIAARMLARGVDGLSIGFVAKLFAPRGAGRDLYEIELLEASIVAVPMQPLARLSVAGGARMSA